MKFWIAPLAALALLIPSCTAEAAGTNAATIADEITTALKGITTNATATSAVDSLSGMVDQLKAAMPSMTEAAGAAAKKLVEGAATATDTAKADLTESLTAINAEITRIMVNAEMAAPIKDVITKLQGVVAMK